MPTELVSGALASRLQNAKLPGYIAIEGPIGVGKTTLTRRLADALSYQVLLEPVTENPFLGDFYQHSGRNALATQLYFLLHRSSQVADIAQQDLLGTQLVSDFLIDKDDLFARVTLEPHEYTLYRQIHETLAIEAPQPDLVVYLQAPAATLMQRIKSRGIDFEQHIDAHYLDTLINAYTEFFHFYDAAPLLIVNATDLDLSSNQQHFEALLDRMIDMEGTRQYFNPHPTLL
ncbi:MAG: deoxynucleoside kinase [Pseudomonadales bacterium]